MSRNVGDVGAADANRPSVRKAEAGEDSKKRRLAASRRSQQREALPFPHDQIDLGQSLEVAEPPREASDLDGRSSAAIGRIAPYRRIRHAPTEPAPTVSLLRTVKPRGILPSSP